VKRKGARSDSQQGGEAGGKGEREGQGAREGEGRKETRGHHLGVDRLFCEVKLCNISQPTESAGDDIIDPPPAIDKKLQTRKSVKFCNVSQLTDSAGDDVIDPPPAIDKKLQTQKSLDPEARLQ